MRELNNLPEIEDAIKDTLATALNEAPLNLSFDESVSQLRLYVELLEKHGEDTAKATIWVMQSVLRHLESMLKG